MVPGGVKIPVPFGFAFSHGATVKSVAPAKDRTGTASTTTGRPGTKRPASGCGW